MKTFAQFLEAERGRSVELARFLGIHKSVMWRYKSGRSKLPARHIRKIVEFSKGELTVESLLPKA